MGNLNQDNRSCEDDDTHVQRVDVGTVTFAVPNHLVLAGQDIGFARALLETAQRRGWNASMCNSFSELNYRVALIPPGGLLLLDTSILADRSGVERLTQLSDLPALPRIYLTTSELDVTALAVREICIAARITIQDILALPLTANTIDMMLGT